MMTGRPLKVAMISYYLPSGSKIGVGHQVHALANALVDLGHHVTIFSSCGTTDGARYATKTLPLRGANRTFKFALALRKLDLAEFDVLHAHGDDYWLWRRRVPAHIRTLHGSCFDEALRIKGTRERLRMVLLGLSEVLASIVADKTVAVSANTRRWIPWVRSIVPNGVDRSRFHPGVRSEHPTVLFVGTYLRRKRGKLLADAFERDVLPRLPTAQLWFVAEDAPPRVGLKSFGRVTDDELADLYGRAWLFCLPSTYEGFGIPYVEAMASGCPVVATPNPGAVELTDRGRYGVLSTETDLGATLLHLLMSESERKRLAEAGLQRSLTFDLELVARSYEACYRQTLATAEARV